MTARFFIITAISLNILLCVFSLSTINAPQTKVPVQRLPADQSFAIEREIPAPELPRDSFSVQPPYLKTAGPLVGATGSYSFMVRKKNRSYITPTTYLIRGEMQNYTWKAMLTLSYNGDESPSEGANHLVVKNLTCTHKSTKKVFLIKSVVLTSEICSVVSHQIERKDINVDLLRFNLSQFDSIQGKCTPTAHIPLTVDVLCPPLQ